MSENLSNLSNENLIARTEFAIKTEKKSTVEVIRHFEEIANRRLYLDRGFPTLSEMVTKKFGYCAGSAMRRINSMKLLRAMPELAVKFETGELSLSVAANVQTFLQTDARDYDRAQRAQLVEFCIGKTTREVEKEFARRNPEREKREFAKHVAEDRIRVSFTISDQLNQKMDHLRALLSHSESSKSLEALVEKLVELGLDKFDPVRRAQRAQNKAARIETRRSSRMHQIENVELSSATPLKSANRSDADDSAVGATSSLRDEDVSFVDRSLPAPEMKTRYISANEQHCAALKYDNRGCEYVDEQSGRRCGSKHFIQLDHIESFSLGGESIATNLQHLCGAHNRLKWQRETCVKEQARDYAQATC